jgi:hypothetical protein
MALSNRVVPVLTSPTSKPVAYAYEEQGEDSWGSVDSRRIFL